MKAWFAIPAFALAIAAAPVLTAQEPGADRPREERRLEMLFRDISLTEAQKAGVDSIVASHRARAAAEVAGADGRRARMRQQVADLRALLTAGQQVVFDRNVATRVRLPQRDPGP